jgi:hypothetical protein
VPFATPARTTPASTPPTGAAWTPELQPDPVAPDAPPPAGGEPRRRRLLIGGIAGAVVVIGIIVAVVASRGGGGAAALPTPTASTVVLPVPTPTIAPVARTASTAFTKVLPMTLLQYVLATSAPETSWVGAGAVEAYSETYSNGGSGKLIVLAGQWETAAAADAYAKQLVTAVPSPTTATTAPRPTRSAAASASASAAASAMPPETGNVTAAGQTVGTYAIRDAGDGTGIAIWTNGSSVFRAAAPVAEIHNVYAAYPL